LNNDGSLRIESAVEVQEDFRIVRRKASLVHFLRDPVSFFRSLSQHDGSLTEISLGGRKFYVLSDPALIRDILSTRGAMFEKFPQGNPKQKLFGNGLLTSEGAAQKRQRRMLLPGFHRDKLQLYARQMVASVERLTASWTNGRKIDISHAMNDVTLEIIGSTLLGVEDKSVMGELGAHLHTMLSLVNRFVLPWGDLLMKLPLPSTVRYRNAATKLDEMVYRLIGEARREHGSDDLIGMLVESSLSDIEIRDEIVTMIVAGHETVAVGLTWSLFLLARYPQLQDELAARAVEVLGGDDPTAEDYPRLEFLQHAFAEALRVYPPIWILGRRNLEDYTIRNFQAPKGSVFLVCMADLHRRAEFFRDPDEFKPERWAAPDWPTYAYIPFGGGERRCIGERFAWMEAVIVLACLLRNWRFTVVDEGTPAMAAKLTLHPRGAMRLYAVKR
jgi:cytochrome P450